jgi:hypothetical protein
LIGRVFTEAQLEHLDPALKLKVELVIILLGGVLLVSTHLAWALLQKTYDVRYAQIAGTLEHAGNREEPS